MKRLLRHFVPRLPTGRLAMTKPSNLLTVDPYHPGLRTHKVVTTVVGEAFSSRVTGDIRII